MAVCAELETLPEVPLKRITVAKYFYKNEKSGTYEINASTRHQQALSIEAEEYAALKSSITAFDH